MKDRHNRDGVVACCKARLYARMAWYTDSPYHATLVNLFVLVATTTTAQASASWSGAWPSKTSPSSSARRSAEHSVCARERAQGCAPSEAVYAWRRAVRSVLIC